MNLLFPTRDCSNGTFSKADEASFALIWQDAVRDKGSTYSGRAFFFKDMRLIFLAEVADGGKDRVWGSLAQTAKRPFLDCLPQLNKQVKVFHLAFSFSYSLEDFQHL